MNISSFLNLDFLLLSKTKNLVKCVLPSPMLFSSLQLIICKCHKTRTWQVWGISSVRLSLKRKKKSQFTVACSSRASSSCVTEPVCLGKCLKKKKKGSQKESGFDSWYLFLPVQVRNCFKMHIFIWVLYWDISLFQPLKWMTVYKLCM